MSMTSKVNLGVRTMILSLLPTGLQRSNRNLQTYIGHSLRSIQEATQKLTKEGVLTSTKHGGVTFYARAEQKQLTASATA